MSGSPPTCAPCCGGAEVGIRGQVVLQHAAQGHARRPQRLVHVSPLSRFSVVVIVPKMAI